MRGGSPLLAMDHQNSTTGPQYSFAKPSSENQWVFVMQRPEIVPMWGTHKGAMCVPAYSVAEGSQAQALELEEGKADTNSCAIRVKKRYM